MPHPPFPDARAKPHSPTQLRPQTWGYLLRRTVHEFVRDECVDAAAALTFFSVLALSPAALATIALVGVFLNEEDVVERVLSLLGPVVPDAVTETLRTVLTGLAGSSGAGFTLVLSVATALWSASIYVSAFGRAVNRIYQVDEGRPYWKRKPAQFALTVGLILLGIVIALVVVLSGPVARTLGELLGIGQTALDVWNVARWPVLALAVVGVVTLLYKGTGNLRMPRLRWLSLGALLAIVALGIASVGFAFYVTTFADYDRTFGALAGIIVFLIWLFLVNLALLLGVEFNAELERGRQLQAGIPAEKQIQLPRRDTTASERQHDFTRVTEERGTLIREDRELPRRTDTLLARARQGVSSVWRRGTR